MGWCGIVVKYYYLESVIVWGVWLSLCGEYGCKGERDCVVV